MRWRAPLPLLLFCLLLSCAHGERTEPAVTAQIAAQLAVLDDAADKLHLDRTPAVARLIELGAPAFAPAVEHLDHPDVLHRLRAQRVVEGLSRRHFGFDGTAWPDGALDRWQVWWSAIAYDARAEPESRAAAVSRLRAGLPSS